MPQIDYSTWVTKADAAARIAVSTKQVERMATDGKLESALYRRPQGGPRITVYHPRDVARLAKDRNPDPPAGYVEPADSGSMKQNGQNGQNAAVAVRLPQRVSDSQDHFLQAIAAVSPPRVRLAEKLFLTFEEAAEYTGLSLSCLRATLGSAISEHKGPHGRHLLRRADLDKL